MELISKDAVLNIIKENSFIYDEYETDGDYIPLKAVGVSTLEWEIDILPVFRYEDLQNDDIQNAFNKGYMRGACDELRNKPTGKWIKRKDDGLIWYECSNCGKIGSCAFRHCPHCGSHNEEYMQCACLD